MDERVTVEFVVCQADVDDVDHAADEPEQQAPDDIDAGGGPSGSSRLCGYVSTRGQNRGLPCIKQRDHVGPHMYR